MRKADLQASPPMEQQVIIQSLDFMYLFALVGGLAVLARFLSPQDSMVFPYDAMQLVFFAMLIPFFAFRRVGWRTRAAALVVVLAAVGSIGILARGLLSQGWILLTFSCIVATLMFKRAFTLALIAYAILWPVICYAVLRPAGLGGVPDLPGTTLQDWVVRFVGMGVFLPATEHVLSRLLHSLGEANDRLHQTNGELTRLNDHLEASAEALRASEEALRDRNEALQRSEEVLRDRNEALLKSEESLRQVNEVLDKKRERLQDMAFNDPLTGLANQYLLDETVADYVSMMAPLWLFRVRLRRLDRIRDTMGASIGDEFVRMMAARVRKSGERMLIVARSDRDSFSIVATADMAPQPQAFADGVLRALSYPCTIGSWTHRPVADISYACFPDDAVSWLLLEQKVGTAMMVSERGNAGEAVRWTAQMDAEMQEALQLERDLHVALRKGEITAAYQPLVDARTGFIRGFEALMRWVSPEHGRVSPARFIPVLEDTGLIVSFGAWMLEHACRQNVVWQKETGLPLVLSVNVSPIQIRRGGFPATVRHVLEETGMPPETLELEVTESVLIDNVGSVLADLHTLRNMGCRISMDDFGTGYSSLSYLRTLPIHTLKIDKSFVSDIGSGGDVRVGTAGGFLPDAVVTPLKSPVRMIGSIIALAHDLNLAVVAEGVETELQRQHLADHHIDLMQGYMFAKPLDPVDALRLLARDREEAKKTASNVRK